MCAFDIFCLDEGGRMLQELTLNGLTLNTPFLTELLY